MTDKNEVDPVVENEQEDVLDVTDRLAAELNESSDSTQTEEAQADEEEVVPASEETAADDEDVVEEAEAEVAEEVIEEPAVTEDVVEDTDLVSEEDAVADDSEDKVEETEVSDEAAAEEATATEESTEPEASQEAEATETEESAEVELSVAELQARISELEATNEKLLAQNTKMKAAIHAELAEKVVDARIAVGHLMVEDREEALAEHKARSASSLADSLVDIRTFAEKNNYQVTVVGGTVPSLEIRAQATSESDSSVVFEESTELVEEEVVVDADKLLIEGLSDLLLNGVEKTLRKNSR